MTQVGAPGGRSSKDVPAQHLAVRYDLPGKSPSYRGIELTWHLAMRLVPPSDLDWFRLVALGATPGENPANLNLCMQYVLSNDIILGSGDVVPLTSRFMDGG